MDQDLSQYKCLPPFIENHKAHDCLLWEQQALANQVGTRTCSTSEGEGQPGAERSLSREGLADLPGSRRIRWSCAMVW